MLNIERSADLGLVLESLGGVEEGTVAGLKVYTTGIVPQQMGSSGPMRVVLSTADVNRFGDVVEQTGWRLQNYVNNPVLMWNHDHSLPSVGRVMNLAAATELTGELEFAPTPRGQEIEALYRGGYLNAVSVGFIPGRVRIRRDQNGEFAGLLFIDNELIETSATNVPANPYTLRVGEPGQGVQSVGLAPGTLLEWAGLTGG